MAFLRARTTLLTTFRRTFSSSSSTPINETKPPKMADYLLTNDLASQIGTSMPISMMRIGTLIHNIELRPSEGGKLVRSAGTVAKILKEPSSTRRVLVRLPSGVSKLIDTRCRATIGQSCLILVGSDSLTVSYASLPGARLLEAEL
uniref:Large ribosomal subunit protein uL2 C-terminal domain-containing protein n=1 Tax=Chenopodium quinoa TaxID=63459 RepID=A0A803L945_CHEQI